MSRTSDRGFALIWALVLAVLVAGASSVLVLEVRTASTTAATAVSSAQAFFAAEGGLAQARRRLSEDAGYPGETLRIGACMVRIGVERAGEGWKVEIEAEPGRAFLQCRLRRGDGLPMVHAWHRVR